MTVLLRLWQPAGRRRDKKLSEFLWAPRYLLPYSFCPGVTGPWTEVLGLSAERVPCRLLLCTWQSPSNVAGHPSASSATFTLFAACVLGFLLWTWCPRAAGGLTLGAIALQRERSCIAAPPAELPAHRHWEIMERSLWKEGRNTAVFSIWDWYFPPLWLTWPLHSGWLPSV